MTDIEALQSRLDALWVDYLDLLDIYTKGQEQIQKHFAAGFFSLAQANARSSIGRRYGSDWYDDRTKATTRIKVEPYEQTGDGGQPSSTKVCVLEAPQYLSSDKTDKTPVPDEPELEQQPTPPDTPGKEDHEPKEDSAPAKKQQKDALFWFGMLPPQSLRSAQASFRSAVHSTLRSSEGNEKIEESSVLAATSNAARGMRAIEFEISKLRKTIRQTQRATQVHKEAT